MELFWLYRAIWHICYKNGSFSGNHCTDQNSIYGLSPCAKLISKSAGYHVQIPFMSNDWACVQQFLLPSVKLNSFNLIDMLARQEGKQSFLWCASRNFCKHYYHLIEGFCHRPSGLFRLTANALASHFLQNHTAEGTDYFISLF